MNVQLTSDLAGDAIARVEAIPVFLPCELKIGAINRSTELSAVVVEIETAEGVIGHGFTAITDEEVVSAAVNSLVAPNLVGMPAMSREAVAERLYWLLSPRGQTGYASHVASAIDIALWDIAGKKLQMPVWRLLGGARSKVESYVTFGFAALDREELAEAAAHLSRQGQKRLKMVVGHHALARRDSGRSLDAVIREDEARVRAVRMAVGDDVDLFIDANCSLDKFHAQLLAERIADCDIRFFEEPLRGNDIGSLADLRRKIRIPVAAGQNEGQLFRYRDLLMHQAVDVLQPNVCIGGGYTMGAKIAGMAQAFNTTIDNGGAFPFHNMHLHAAMANGGLVEWHLVSVELCKGVFEGLTTLGEGEITLPETPGLGFSMSPERKAELLKMPTSMGRGKG
ncbi:mandelate racemase/muconate lactonizing enzyme family protein [Ochrobactrum sp. RH2CCR150]|uniref:mandelate racemase/muconate lactonizing enzyme family protein n=1 Tax=Ochrobactrum sp. RH2CCR150 TaxID=2587044 RepID=UPI0015F879A9|nr:L-alanine-DL-glutamate epimerase-like enolase superfamily enzyme [Ochrobactrum sp. RH2CCR150]